MTKRVHPFPTFVSDRRARRVHDAEADEVAHEDGTGDEEVQADHTLGMARTALARARSDVRLLAC